MSLPESLDETIRVSAACLPPLRELYPEGHPVRAVATAELGKLLTVDELPNADGSAFPPRGIQRLRLAHSTLQQAYRELEIGFGQGGGQGGREALQLARHIGQEIDMWDRGVRNLKAVGPAR